MSKVLTFNTLVHKLAIPFKKVAKDVGNTFFSPLILFIEKNYCIVTIYYALTL
jgi:hypothetical protein